MPEETYHLEEEPIKRDPTRRDFLAGMALTSATLLCAPKILADEIARLSRGHLAGSDHYPPLLTGMRGSHKGSFEVAHALAWRGEKPADYEQLDEHYDLVVVGAGMSGLAAAWYWRKRMGGDARILILDNHDDFGGHAKRNEFQHEGRMVLCLGGAQNMEDPQAYSRNSKDLLRDIGIDDDFLNEMAENNRDDYALGGSLGADTGLALPSDNGLETVSGPWLTWMLGDEGYAEAIDQLPLSVEDRKQLTAFIGGDRDYLAGKSLTEKYRYINSVSYHEFLHDAVGLSQTCIEIFDSRLSVFLGMTGGSLTVFEAIVAGSPGLNSMGWFAGVANSLAVRAAPSAMQIRMFPDGNASIARLLVHKLIPQVAPDMKGVEDVAVSRFDYSALDREANEARVRLNSTVVGVRETNDSTVEVDYVRLGHAKRVTADHCVLACYNGIIPHLCPDMSEAQKDALAYGVKSPFVYASVLTRNGKAFAKLQANLIQCPGQPFQWVGAGPTMTTGGYEPPRNAEDPMALLLMGSPTEAPRNGESLHALLRMARQKLYATSLSDFEQMIREQLQALLGSKGFDHDEDIVAITVNRISHGYAYEYLTLNDPEFENGNHPNEIGRAQFGRISIANSDSEARAYMDAAWDAAWRAVEEQAGLAPR